ncbi:MAG: hypothetical protein BWY79_02078 [Actinobacteria bacterium ADurb.Bin444]|nr:MAG: hypothetical protein BWY79_02078 [Actinobacteria bacterium ADurb.Bin444]
MELRRLQRRQTAKYYKIGGRIEVEARCYPESADQCGAQRRTHNAGQVELQGVERHGVAHVPSTNQFNHECLSGRHVKGIHHAAQGREHEDQGQGDGPGAG